MPTLCRLLLWLAFAPDLAALGSDDFHAREAAERRLGARADYCHHLLPVDHPCPEVRRRARRVAHRVVPETCPPVSLLSGSPLPEWWPADCSAGEVFVIQAHCPGPGWGLGYLRPDAGAPLYPVVKWYGERARTQYEWRDWELAGDGRRATRLLCEDLLRLGVPACLVRKMVDRMRAREEALWKTKP